MLSAVNMQGWQRSLLVAIVGTIIITIVLAFLNVAGAVSIILVLVVLFLVVQYFSSRRAT
jgi:ABC-type transport system involved in cytochrome bd biosynthesis fused ATPase/permease subunit